MTVRISIAMATYNGAKYLQEQLDSFICQTRQPYELVVCDDGSTDATVEILETFRQQAPFAVHVYLNETNLGYSKNFEKCLSFCAGDIIFLSDQDDIWYETKIELIINEFNLHDAAWVIVNDAEITQKDLQKTGLTVAGQLVSAGIPVDQLLLGCCIAFRSKLNTLVSPIPHNIHGHDGWINTLGNALQCRHFVPKVLQLYRRHGNNTSSSPTTITSQTTGWHLLREKLKWQNIKCDPRAASMKRFEQLSIMKARLEMHGTYLNKELPHGIRISDVISELQQKIIVNEARRGIQQMSLPKRLIAGIEFFVNGGYSQFEGLKSFMRDVIR